MGRSASSTVEMTFTASEFLRAAATRSADLVGSVLLDLAATTTPDPAASSERTSCTYAASRASVSCWVEPLTGPPRKTTLEDGTIWSGVTLMRSPAARPFNAALAEAVMRSVEWSVPARIACVSTVTASWSGLPAAAGAVANVANGLATVFRKVILDGSAQTSFKVTVEPTLAPAAIREAVAFLTRSASTPGATTRATVLPVRRPFSTAGATAEEKVSRAAAFRLAVSRSVRSWVFSARSVFICSVRRAPMSCCSGPAPKTIPTASARKIETMETR